MAEKTKDFVLKDKQEASDQEALGQEASDQEKPNGAPPESGAPHSQMPKMTFSTFILSLNHSALFHLGVIEDPSTGTKSKNIELAKQSIDIISLLGEKTKGNLTEEEDGMLKSLLYDLRMIYVKETQ